MKLAMSMANELGGEKQIDYVNTHGTSTPVGDTMELSGIKKVFTEAGYQPYVGSTKVRARATAPLPQSLAQAPSPPPVPPFDARSVMTGHSRTASTSSAPPSRNHLPCPPHAAVALGARPRRRGRARGHLLAHHDEQRLPGRIGQHQRAGRGGRGHEHPHQAPGNTSANLAWPSAPNARWSPLLCGARSTRRARVLARGGGRPS